MHRVAYNCVESAMFRCYPHFVDLDESVVYKYITIQIICTPLQYCTVRLLVSVYLHLHFYCL